MGSVGSSIVKPFSNLFEGVAGVISGKGPGTSPSSQIKPLAETKAQADELEQAGQERRRKARQAQTLLTSRGVREASTSVLQPSVTSGLRPTLG